MPQCGTGGVPQARVAERAALASDELLGHVRRQPFDVLDRAGALKHDLRGAELVAPVHDHDLRGELRQEDRTSRLIFGFRYLINYISTFATLVPGDVIVTGTPTGAGARFDPPRWLKPGDIIEVEAEGIGTLRNGVVDEQ